MRAWRARRIGAASASCWTPPARPLRAALGSGIELIKPSLGELETLAGRTLPDPREQEAEALALVRAGAARLVAVTLGEDGAFVASADGVIRLAALPCEVRSAVGAGDSFTAAMTLALARGAALAGRAGLGRRRRHRGGGLRRDGAHPAGGRGDAIPAADRAGAGVSAGFSPNARQTREAAHVSTYPINFLNSTAQRLSLPVDHRPAVRAVPDLTRIVRPDCHCEERSDEAIPCVRRGGLPGGRLLRRCAPRNDSRLDDSSQAGDALPSTDSRAALASDCCAKRLLQ